MKRIPIVLGAAVALTLLTGCAGGGSYGSYYGGGYSGARSDGYGYRQPYPYAGSYRRNRNDYYSRDPDYYDGRNYYRR